MGAQIAAHAANAGLPVLLLDLSADVARQGLERAMKLRPDPFFTPECRRLISLAGFDEGLPRLGTFDWVVEAVVERLDVKQALFARVEEQAASRAVISSNTSGLPIAALGDGRSAAFRRRLLGTHFFNPPRYLPLLEIIPTPDTDQAIVDEIGEFADRRLGKGVVVANDSPGFIANRLGMFGVVGLLQVLAAGHYTIEEIDAITGKAIGRPKSATFRTVDIAGLDVLANVARDLSTRLEDPAERAAFTLPPLVEEMLRRGWIGEKAGQGLLQAPEVGVG
jgi:3-hydroxyacyl-CoA dehydrogenase